MRKVLLAIFLIILIGAAIITSKEIFQPQKIRPAPTNNADSLKTFQSLTIISIPAEATVVLNGETIGTTPISLSNLTGTSNRLSLEKAGFESVAFLLTPPYENNSIRLNLQPLKVTTSTTQLIDDDFQTELDNLNANDPNIPLELAGQVVVPYGFRFPDNPDLTQAVVLEPIPEPLVQDPMTELMPALARSALINKLNTLYIYDPARNEIIAHVTGAIINLINFGVFDPLNANIASGSSMLWYNHNRSTCELRTHPKSPEKINQKILPQSSLSLPLTTPGIYIFFCQGNPGPTQVITVL